MAVHRPLPEGAGVCTHRGRPWTTSGSRADGQGAAAGQARLPDLSDRRGKGQQGQCSGEGREAAMAAFRVPGPPQLLSSKARGHCCPQRAGRFRTVLGGAGWRPGQSPCVSGQEPSSKKVPGSSGGSHSSHPEPLGHSSGSASGQPGFQTVPREATVLHGFTLLPATPGVQRDTAGGSGDAGTQGPTTPACLSTVSTEGWCWNPAPRVQLRPQHPAALGTHWGEAWRGAAARPLGLRRAWTGAASSAQRASLACLRPRPG